MHHARLNKHKCSTKFLINWVVVFPEASGATTHPEGHFPGKWANYGATHTHTHIYITHTKLRLRKIVCFEATTAMYWKLTMQFEKELLNVIN